MVKDEDYRNTEYCPILDKVEKQKEDLEKEIKLKSPRTKIFYNKVKNRESIYNKKFAKIYNNKCAYCGAMLRLLPIESFEVDHFLNESSFPDTTEGRTEAGRISNLVWSCISCNRGKSKITVNSPYDNLLNTDNGNIATVFRRDKNYYIQICDTYKDDEFIQQFYDALHLGYETRRLDYLLLQLRGKYKSEKNVERKQKLGEELIFLIERRNGMTVTDR